MAVQPLVDLLRALGEPLDQCPVVQPEDLGRARAFVHRPPADTQALGERGPLGGQVQVIGRHQLGVQPVAVQGRPAAVRTLGGVLDQHVGVVLWGRRRGSCGARRPPPPAPRPPGSGRCRCGRGGRRCRGAPGSRSATWRASARPSASSRRIWGLPPAASSDTLLGEEKQWSKACTRSLTRLPRCCQAPVECFAVQLAGVGAQDLAAQPLDRLDLDPPARRPAGRPPAPSARRP